MNWFEPNSLQLIVADLNEIAADAYHHRIRPASKKGGGGAYNASKGGFAYAIPKKLEVNRRARFTVQALSSDFLLIQASSIVDGSLSITATVDDRGTLKNIAYPGVGLHPPHPEDKSEKRPSPVKKVYGDTL